MSGRPKLRAHKSCPTITAPCTEKVARIGGRFGRLTPVRKCSPYADYKRSELLARGAGSETNLRRALSLPDCHRMAKLHTSRKTTRTIVAPQSGNSGPMRPRSVSFPPEILMFAAVAENDVAELRRILDEHDEVDINQQSPSGLTALHYAAAEGSLECLQELVARGVLLDVHDSQGCSPLDFAAKGGYFDCAALLVRAGAHIGNIINGVK